MYNTVILEAAQQHLGVEEWPGAKHNPVIMSYFDAAGHSWVDGDETAWCAAYVNAVLAEVGLIGTGALNARSFLDWGEAVALKDLKPGDVVVFWRESPESWKGHVGFVSSIDGNNVLCLGGNQGNAVSVAPYPMSRVLGFRRADGGKSVDNRPVLRKGSRGALVGDLQTILSQLGYFAGAVDEWFGDITEGGVMKFQKAHDLVSDGVVGKRTWDKLMNKPKAAPRRTATVKDLRAYGSQQIKQADEAETAVRRGVLAAGGLSAVDMGVSAMERLQGAGEALSASDGLIRENWLPLAILALAVIGYFVVPPILERLRQRRVEDHNTGVHIGTRGE